MGKTAADKWKNEIVNHRKKCQAILKISESIRYVGVINSYGRTLAGIVKSDVKPLLKTDQAKNEFFIIPTLINMRKDSSRVLGKMNYVLLQHQKVSILVLQKNAVTYYISLDKSKDLDSIVSKIQKTV